MTQQFLGWLVIAAIAALVLGIIVYITGWKVACSMVFGSLALSAALVWAIGAVSGVQIP